MCALYFFPCDVLYLRTLPARRTLRTMSQDKSLFFIKLLAQVFHCSDANLTNTGYVYFYYTPKRIPWKITRTTSALVPGDKVKRVEHLRTFSNNSDTKGKPP
jgi:hypothetical protein